MVMIGTDSHNRTHTFVVDHVGRCLVKCALRVNTDEHLQLVTWAVRSKEVIFALEDC